VEGKPGMKWKGCLSGVLRGTGGSIPPAALIFLSEVFLFVNTERDMNELERFRKRPKEMSRTGSYS
jgi:hypothetical protein